MPAPDGGRYRIYTNDGEAFNALLDWMDRKNFPASVIDAEEYASELKERGYYTDSLDNYLNGLIRWL